MSAEADLTADKDLLFLDPSLPFFFLDSLPPSPTAEKLALPSMGDDDDCRFSSMPPSAPICFPITLPNVDGAGISSTIARPRYMGDEETGEAGTSMLALLSHFSSLGGSFSFSLRLSFSFVLFLGGTGKDGNSCSGE